MDITQTILAVIGIVAVVAVGWAGWLAHQFRQAQDDILGRLAEYGIDPEQSGIALRQIAGVAVLAAQQVGGGWEAKLDYAITVVETWCEQHSLSFDRRVVVAAIEAALFEAKSAYADVWEGDNGNS